MKIFLNNKSFRKAAIKYAFESQSKPKGFGALQLVFIDSNGKRYYRHVDDMQMHVNRLAQLKRIYAELGAKLDGTELNNFLNNMSSALDAAVNNPKKPDKINNIARIGRLVAEMQDREKILIHEDLQYSLAAVVLVREDEDPAEYDPEIHDQKIEQFKKDSKGGLRDFFIRANLKEYLPFSELSDEEFLDYLNQSKAIIKALNQTILKPTSDSKSSSS